MKKKYFILALIISAITYGDDFYNQNSIKLEDTVISTTGFEEIRKNVTSSVTVITSQEIKEKNYKSVTDALSSLAIVNIYKDSVNSAVIDLRGQGSTGTSSDVPRAKSKVQVLVDGVSMNSLDAAHGYLPINSIDINSIERIEVIPGGGAVIYGSGTAGGIINIITKNKLSDKKIEGNIGSEIASYSTNNYTGDISAKLMDNLELGINYNYKETDGFRSGSHSKNDNLSINTKYQITDSQKLVLKYGKYTEDANSPSYLTETQLNNDRYGASTSITKYKTDREEYSLQYDNEFIKNLKFNLISYITDTTLKSGTSSTLEDEKLSIKPKLNFDYSKGSLVAGYDFLLNDASRKAGTTLYDMNKTSNSLYINNRYDMSKLQLNTGYRYEVADYSIKNLSGTTVKYDIDKTEKDSALSIGLNYPYSESGKIYLKYEKGYTLPNPTAYIDKDSSGNYVLNDLQGEDFNTYELGFEDYIYKTSIKGALYKTNTKNEIAINMVSHSYTSMYWNYYNLAATERTGLELSLEHSLGKFRITEGFNYINSEVTEGTYTGKKIPNVAKISASLEMKYSFNDKLDLITNTIYKDKYYLDANNQSGLINNRFVTNITANYNINKMLKLYTGINNLFDEKYFNNVSYSSGTFTYDPAAERNYFAGFKYSF